MTASNFISGTPVTELEAQLVSYVGMKHYITCANGTDILTFTLMAWGIRAGDAVFVPDFRFSGAGNCGCARGRKVKTKSNSSC